jgi:hypothetical protein
LVEHTCRAFANECYMIFLSRSLLEEHWGLLLHTRCVHIGLCVLCCSIPRLEAAACLQGLGRGSKSVDHRGIYRSSYLPLVALPSLWQPPRFLFSPPRNKDGKGDSVALFKAFYIGLMKNESFENKNISIAFFQSLLERSLGLCWD